MGHHGGSSAELHGLAAAVFQRKLTKPLGDKNQVTDEAHAESMDHEEDGAGGGAAEIHNAQFHESWTVPELRSLLMEYRPGKQKSEETLSKQTKTALLKKCNLEGITVPPNASKGHPVAFAEDQRGAKDPRPWSPSAGTRAISTTRYPGTTWTWALSEVAGEGRSGFTRPDSHGGMVEGREGQEQQAGGPSAEGKGTGSRGASSEYPHRHGSVQSSHEGLARR